MGISALAAEFLAEARASGVRFDSTVTIGRQALLLGPLRLRRLLRRHGVPVDRDLAAGFRDGPWADPLLAALGARSVTALDASAYEGADVVHDLNEPVPPDLHERFDVVLDAGSLEHVFNVPMALRNYMAMTRPGGRVLLLTPTNNHAGHGFYQFSAELFHRVFSAGNGFAIERAEIAEHDVARSRPVLGTRITYERTGRRRPAPDPAALGGRALVQGRRPAILMVQARRLAGGPVLAQWPQQSDYRAAWAAGRPPASRTLAGRLGRRLGPAHRATIQLDLAPGLLPLLDPLRHVREARRRSLGGRHRS